MELSDSAEPVVFQRFKSEDGRKLGSLPVQVCSETGKRYIFWSDIQSAFPGVIWLGDRFKNIVLFMIDKDGALRYPLCIENRLANSFTVIYGNLQNHHSDGPERDPQVRVDSSTSIPATDSDQSVIAPLSRILKVANGLYESLHPDVDLVIFQQRLANARHYQRMLLDELEKKERIGATVLVDGKDLRQILGDFRKHEKKGLQADYDNICWSTLPRSDDARNTAASRLFVVLPFGLDFWDASDPATHQFRLYFLCEFRNNAYVDLAENVPQHVHISNHPGYTVNRPLEFFHEYGDYILRVLEMIKRGYSRRHIPPLDTFEIFWGCDSDILGSHLSKDTIGPLINKTVEYIQRLSPRKWHSNLWLTYSQSVAIKSYLDVQDGDDAGGNLYRNNEPFQNSSWICQAHKGVSMYQRDLQELQKFVVGHEGHLDIRQATISVNLDSESDSDRFCTLLTGTRFSFGILVNLKWSVTPAEVSNFCDSVSRNMAQTLEIDMVSTDFYPQDHNRVSTALFSKLMMGEDGFSLVALHGFPHDQEYCLLIDDVEVRLSSPPKPPIYDWMELKSTLAEFEHIVTTSDDPAECKAASMDLQSELAKRDLTGVVALSVGDADWIGVFDLKAGVFVDVISRNMGLPPSVASTGSITKMTIWLSDMEVDQKLYHFIQADIGMRELEIWTREHDVLSQLDTIGNLRRASVHPLQVTLYDVADDWCCRVVTQLTIHPRRATLSGNSLLNIHYISNQSMSDQEHREEPPLALEIPRWGIDDLFCPLSDYQASVFNMATQQHPSVLTSLNLDVSACSNAVLATLRSILRRSSLEHLIIKCVPFDPTVSNVIVQILHSIQWSTLKSLVLTGDNIDGWLQLWPHIIDSRLLCLHIQGTGPTLQKLSHSCALFIHNLASACPLSELEIENILLEDKHDWVPIVESIDPAFLENLRLCASSSRQLLETAEAAHLFLSAFKRDSQDIVHCLPAYQTSFHLDFTHLSVLGLVHAAYALRRSDNLDRLYISCSSFEASLSDIITQVLDSVSWTTLKLLELYGNNIDEWINLCETVVAPQLHSLEIRGMGSTPQELSHLSALFLQRLLASSPMETLRIDNVILEDKDDWIPIMESVDPSSLKSFKLCRHSTSQLQTCTKAADLYRMKFQPEETKGSDSEWGDLDSEAKDLDHESEDLDNAAEDQDSESKDSDNEAKDSGSD